jgi:hypothetical protein
VVPNVGGSLPLRRQDNRLDDHQMLLKKKVAVIYDANGAIGVG